MTYVLICCDQLDFLEVLIIINYLYVQSSGTIYIFTVKQNYKQAEYKKKKKTVANRKIVYVANTNVCK